MSISQTKTWTRCSRCRTPAGLMPGPIARRQKGESIQPWLLLSSAKPLPYHHQLLNPMKVACDSDVVLVQCWAAWRTVTWRQFVAVTCRASRVCWGRLLSERTCRRSSEASPSTNDWWPTNSTRHPPSPCRRSLPHTITASSRRLRPSLDWSCLTWTAVAGTSSMWALFYLISFSS